LTFFLFVTLFGPSPNKRWLLPPLPAWKFFFFPPNVRNCAESGFFLFRDAQSLCITPRHQWILLGSLTSPASEPRYETPRAYSSLPGFFNPPEAPFFLFKNRKQLLEDRLSDRGHKLISAFPKTPTSSSSHTSRNFLPPSQVGFFSPFFPRPLFLLQVSSFFAPGMAFPKVWSCPQSGAVPPSPAALSPVLHC